MKNMYDSKTPMRRGNMSDWLTKYNSLQAIQPLVADIKMGRVSPSSVLLAIQQLSDEERREMADVLKVIFEALRWVEANGTTN